VIKKINAVKKINAHT